jgi:hypothetical protein
LLGEEPFSGDPGRGEVAGLAAGQIRDNDYNAVFVVNWKTRRIRESKSELRIQARSNDGRVSKATQFCPGKRNSQLRPTWNPPKYKDQRLLGTKDRFRTYRKKILGLSEFQRKCSKLAKWWSGNRGKNSLQPCMWIVLNC